MSASCIPSTPTLVHGNQSEYNSFDSKMRICDLLNPLDETPVHSRKRPLEIRLPIARFQLMRTNSSQEQIKKNHSIQSNPTSPTSVDSLLNTMNVTSSSVELPLNQCRYRNGKCTNPRATKTNGQLHTLCAVHRHRNIVNQHRVDARRRFERRNAKTHQSHLIAV